MFLIRGPSMHGIEKLRVRNKAWSQDEKHGCRTICRKQKI